MDLFYATSKLFNSSLPIKQNSEELASSLLINSSLISFLPISSLFSKATKKIICCKLSLFNSLDKSDISLPYDLMPLIKELIE